MQCLAAAGPLQCISSYLQARQGCLVTHSLETDQQLISAVPTVPVLSVSTHAEKSRLSAASADDHPYVQRERASPWSLRAVSTMTPLSSPTRHSAIRVGCEPGRPCREATSFASTTWKAMHARSYGSMFTQVAEAARPHAEAPVPLPGWSMRTLQHRNMYCS
jgi:hypothetical protein